MSHKIEPNKERDPLAELFRQKLENHKVFVDNSEWGEIKKRLKGGRKMALWTFFTAISAAVIALLFILSPSEKTPIDQPLQGETTNPIINDSNNEAVASSDVVSDQEQESILAQPVEETRIAANKSTIVSNKQATTSKEDIDYTPTNENAINSSQDKELAQNIAINESVRSEIVNNNAAASSSVGIEQFNNTEVKSIQQDEKKEEVKELQQVYRASLFEFEEDLSGKKEKNNWTLAALYGGGGSSNSGTENGNVPLRMSMDIDNSLANSSFADQTALVSYDEGKHFPEMSFSFTVGKRINSRLAIESGLTYTYLYSKFEGLESFSNYELKQHLHYIGIPVNVVVYILDGTSKWNIYASGGGMLEKGLRAKYKETVNEVMGQTTTDNRGESISGVQWSVNASIGATYELSKSFNLFVAPRISYYFDNDQPTSIRTDKNISFGLNIGLRYNL